MFNRQAPNRNTTMTPEERGDNRRSMILSAAVQVFLRYGYKKASMDDLARAAGLSRQGLYLHFKTKEELFQEAIQSLMQGSRAAYRAALARGERSTFDRLLESFDAFHGDSIGHMNGELVAELLEAASNLLGDAPDAHERTFIADVATLLSEAGWVRREGRSSITPKQVAETLYATSYGLKHRVKTRAEYRTGMSVALRIILGAHAEATVNANRKR